jgi:DNA polymerase
VIKHKPLTVEYVKGKGTEKSWGAKLVENVTQAVARDLLADCLVKLDDADLKVLLHVHDSVIIECPKGEAKKTMEIIKAIACKAPDWMPELPLEIDIRRCSNGLNE